jgi:hypothetical protein
MEERRQQRSLAGIDGQAAILGSRRNLPDAIDRSDRFSNTILMRTRAQGSSCADVDSGGDLGDIWSR